MPEVFHVLRVEGGHRVGGWPTYDKRPLSCTRRLHHLIQAIRQPQLTDSNPLFQLECAARSVTETNGIGILSVLVTLS